MNLSYKALAPHLVCGQIDISVENQCECGKDDDKLPQQNLRVEFNVVVAKPLSIFVDGLLTRRQIGRMINTLGEWGSVRSETDCIDKCHKSDISDHSPDEH